MCLVAAQMEAMAEIWVKRVAWWQVPQNARGALTAHARLGSCCGAHHCQILRNLRSVRSNLIGFWHKSARAGLFISRDGVLEFEERG